VVATRREDRRGDGDGDERVTPVVQELGRGHDVGHLQGDEHHGNSNVTPKMNIINKTASGTDWGCTRQERLATDGLQKLNGVTKLKYATVIPEMKNTSDAETNGMITCVLGLQTWRNESPQLPKEHRRRRQNSRRRQSLCATSAVQRGVTGTCTPYGGVARRTVGLLEKVQNLVVKDEGHDAED